MVSVVIPTRNRNSTLAIVINSYISQELVSEIIIVDDFSDDPVNFNKDNTKIRVIRNLKPLGPYESKLRGVNAALNELVLIGEDDLFLGDKYVKKLVNEREKYTNLGVISGTIIYLEKGESCLEAKNRILTIQDLHKSQEIFDYKYLLLNIENIPDTCVNLPFTHAIFLTTKSLYQNYFRRTSIFSGNNYREESYGQIKMYLDGHVNIFSPLAFCYHMNKQDVPVGGNRLPRFWNLISTALNNGRFIDLIFGEIRSRPEFGEYSRLRRKLDFAYHTACKLYVKPILSKFKL